MVFGFSGLGLRVRGSVSAFVSLGNIMEYLQVSTFESARIRLQGLGGLRAWGGLRLLRLRA